MASVYSDQLSRIFSKWSAAGPDLDDYIRTIGEMFDIYEPYIGDRVDSPGWGRFLDVDECPVGGLPYLAQWVGERLPTGIDETTAREWIKHTPNQLRGTRRGIAKATQATLTGTQTVALHPRSKLDGTSHPDFLTVLTQDSETPNPTATLNAILRAMPADIELNFDHPSGVIWLTVQGEGTWADVSNDGTWADVATTQIRTGGGWYVYTGADLSPWA